MITKKIQEGIEAVPQSLKVDTAIQHAGTLKVDTATQHTATRRAGTKRKRQPEEAKEPVQFRLAHPRQRYVVQNVKEGKKLHVKGANEKTMCRWRWVEEGGRPRGNIKLKYLMCTSCFP